LPGPRIRGKTRARPVQRLGRAKGAPGPRIAFLQLTPVRRGGSALPHASTWQPRGREIRANCVSKLSRHVSRAGNATKTGLPGGARQGPGLREFGNWRGGSPIRPAAIEPAVEPFRKDPVSGNGRDRRRRYGGFPDHRSGRCARSRCVLRPAGKGRPTALAGGCIWLRVAVGCVGAVPTGTGAMCRCNHVELER